MTKLRGGAWPVVLATNNGDIGGGEVMLLRIAEAIRSQDLPVTIVAPSGPGDVAEAAHDAGFDTVRLRATGRRDWMLGLRRWDRLERRGLLWCNGLVPAAATAGHGGRIVHLHQRPPGAVASLLARIARLGALDTLVPSASMTRWVRGATVLPNWTEPIAAPQRRREPRGPFVVGFLGRLSPDKGIVVLAEAMRELERRAPGRFRLLVAGEPRFVKPADYALVDAALRGVDDLTTRAGWMDRDGFFESVDVLVMPSIADESFGLGAAEAMAARVPVIVSDDGALPEVVGPDGIVVPRSDPAALADAIERWASSEADVEVPFRRWEENFSPEAGATAVMRILDRAGRRGASPRA